MTVSGSCIRVFEDNQGVIRSVGREPSERSSERSNCRALPFRTEQLPNEMEAHVNVLSPSRTKSCQLMLFGSLVVLENTVARSA